MYRASVLGYFWSVFPPLVTAGIWIFLQGQNVVKFNDTGVPYPVYVLVSMMLWQIFRDSLLAPIQSAQKGQNLLTKINFPRESIVVSGFYMTLFNGGLKLLIILFVFIAFGITPSWFALVGLISIFSLIIMGLTIGLLLVPLSLLYTDIQKGIPIAMQFLLYLTPVVYPTPKDGIAAWIMKLNPIVPVLETVRRWILNTGILYFKGFIIITGCMLLILIAGLFLFNLAMPIVNERLGSSK
jgi:lipopolysaccharide transport system permease protein